MGFETLKLFERGPEKLQRARRGKGIRRACSERVHGRKIGRDEKGADVSNRLDTNGDDGGDERVVGEEGRGDGVGDDARVRGSVGDRESSAPDIFDLAIERPGALYERVEVDERVRVLREGERARGASATGSAKARRWDIYSLWTWKRFVRRLQALLDDGITSISVVLLTRTRSRSTSARSGDLACARWDSSTWR